MYILPFVLILLFSSFGAQEPEAASGTGGERPAQGAGLSIDTTNTQPSFLLIDFFDSICQDVVPLRQEVPGDEDRTAMGLLLLLFFLWWCLIKTI